MLHGMSRPCNAGPASGLLNHRSAGGSEATSPRFVAGAFHPRSLAWRIPAGTSSSSLENMCNYLIMHTFSCQAVFCEKVSKFACCDELNSFIDIFIAASAHICGYFAPLAARLRFVYPAAPAKISVSSVQSETASAMRQMGLPANHTRSVPCMPA